MIIETEAKHGFAAASGSGITVGLALDLSEDLILEGIVRDVVRFVQSMRKNAKLAVEDRIQIWWNFDGQISEALGKFNEYFMSETLTKIISDRKIQDGYIEHYKFKGKDFQIILKKTTEE